MQAFRWLERVQPESLTRLELGTADVSNDTMGAIAQCLATEAFQRVQKVTLDVDDVFVGGRWLQGLPDMPLRGEYCLTWSGGDPDQRRKTQDAAESLRRRGFVVEKVASERLVFSAPSLEAPGAEVEAA